MCAPYGDGFYEERSVDICQRVLDKAEELAAPAALGDLSGKRINELLTDASASIHPEERVRPPSDLPPGVSIFDEHINPSDEGGGMTKDELLGEIANMGADANALYISRELNEGQRLTYSYQVAVLRTLYRELKNGTALLRALPPALDRIKTTAERKRLEELRDRWVKEGEQE